MDLSERTGFRASRGAAGTLPCHPWEFSTERHDRPLRFWAAGHEEENRRLAEFEGGRRQLSMHVRTGTRIGHALIHVLAGVCEFSIAGQLRTLRAGAKRFGDWPKFFARRRARGRFCSDGDP